MASFPGLSREGRHRHGACLLTVMSQRSRRYSKPCCMGFPKQPGKTRRFLQPGLCLRLGTSTAQYLWEPDCTPPEGQWGAAGLSRKAARSSSWTLVLACGALLLPPALLQVKTGPEGAPSTPRPFLGVEGFLSAESAQGLLSPSWQYNAS